MDDAAVGRLFKKLYLSDVKADEARALDDYLALFPGHEELVRRLHARQDEAAVELFAGDEPDAGYVGRFRLIESLGRGGQAEVFLAEDTRLGRRVALKLLDGARAVSDSARMRFAREAEALSRLDHAGLSTAYDVGQDGGVAWIAMRYVEGETLADALARRRWTELSPQLAVAESVARTLHAAHEAGVVHRDVKPGNIIIDAAGEPTLVDFGLVRTDGDASITSAADLLGTPAYMSPEQAAGVGVDRRTDVWSLGVIVYEMLAGRRPFTSSTRAGLLHDIARATPEDPRHTVSGLPRDAAVVCSRALEKDRDRRYATALDLAEELRRVREGRPIVARPAGRAERAWRWSRRHPARAAALVLSVLAVGLVGYLAAAWPELRRGRLETERDEIEGALEAGFLAYDQGDLVAADQAFAELVDRQPACDEAVIGLSMTRLRSGRAREAADILDRRERLYARVPGVHRLRAAAARATGDEAGAAQHEASAAPPTTPLGFYLAGQMALAAARAEGRAAHRRALEAFERAIARAPRPRALHHHGRLQAASGLADPEIGREAVAAALSHWPDSPRTLFWCGVALSRTDPARSLEFFDACLAGDPTSVSALSNRAAALRGLERYDEAAASLEAALRAAPDRADLHANLALLAVQNLGRRELGVAQARAALRLGGDDETLAFSRYVLGVAALEEGDPERALRELACAARLAPGVFLIRHEHGVALLRSGRHVAAAAELEAAVTLDATKPRAWMNLAIARCETGDAAGAASAFATCEELGGAADPRGAELAPALRWRESDATVRAALDRDALDLAARAAAAVGDVALVREILAARVARFPAATLRDVTAVYPRVVAAAVALRREDARERRDLLADAAGGLDEIASLVDRILDGEAPGTVPDVRSVLGLIREDPRLAALPRDGPVGAALARLGDLAAECGD